MKGKYVVIVIGDDGIDIPLITSSCKKAEKLADEKTNEDKGICAYVEYYDGPK